MKKLPSVEKLDKVFKMKKLQQQVTTLRTQQQKHTDRVTELQEEEERVTRIIQLVHQKVQKAIESVGLTTLGHNSSELVENLNKKEAEIQEETT